jgi:hypothetical protein
MGGGSVGKRGTRLVAIAAVVAAFAGCVSSTGSPPVGGSSTPSGTPSLRETIVPIGRAVTTAAGNTVTVKTFLPNIGRAAGSDVYAAADVEACAGKSAPARTGVSRRLFAVETAGQTGWPSRDPVKQPALPAKYIAPNHCAGGWVTFRVPQDKPVLFVILLSSTVVKWKVS